ncbi:MULTISPECIES: polynucleotide adenylyltransferase PcnB [Acidithiobacillus]|uniref:Poly(A) polymerase I n=2 Tax=Acidithiobacillus caldus TaxID=33059 RepID=F9ZNB8_ACICS|nr:MULTISPECIES: polynucleotide adenylyltransferase PcnB [Acidithiobacillus]AEK58161.1 Poly(A) polymerase [Acidithiobacillus caldus SM-1]AUW32800.1 polynucleotide adenylyltransferase PcnB [Acidithiobacillus caldus]MBU2728659.1 polynucleotide adenylyltransferase PcnB [Acidithiobacillus caldus]MBU2734304.1 polynucleotide adenylyltransferase PcnB [Acidithiobacillus caldus ATCC 51756]MBU2746140.1 polynucleotide adenylyltransferase PcnB [Acidithiobacillus caldus]
MVSLKRFTDEVLQSAIETPQPDPEGTMVVAPAVPVGARRIPREEHCLSRRQISSGALQVLNTLHQAGHQAYLVGGSVRDLLLGREPKDYDVATDARPEQVRKLFRRNARLIGRRFILVHVQFGPEIVEVATFRGQGESAEETSERSASGRILADNVYGSLEEDAGRRDFTANALYYNIADRSILDFADGLTDLQAGRLRMIGDPEQRYREDPVRMLRAVRFAAKLGFQMDAAVEAAIAPCRDLLLEVPSARLFEETIKLFLTGHAQSSFDLLRRTGLFAALFPQLDRVLDAADAESARELLRLALEGTDQRVLLGKSVTPAFLFAALLWSALQAQRQHLEAQDKPANVALQQAAAELLEESRGRVAIPRRFALPMREIWDLQPRFTRRGGRRPYALLAHPRFRAAFDFLLLRQQSGEFVDHPELAGLGTWWTEFQEADSEGRKALMEQARREDAAPEAPLGPLPSNGLRRRPRRRRRKPSRLARVPSAADDASGNGTTG